MARGKTDTTWNKNSEPGHVRFGDVVRARADEILLDRRIICVLWRIRRERDEEEVPLCRAATKRPRFTEPAVHQHCHFLLAGRGCPFLDPLPKPKAVNQKYCLSRKLP